MRKLNSRPKYLASRTLTDPLEWQHSTVLEGEVAEAVNALKRQVGGDLLAIGSAELVRTLIEHDLVDELRLMIDPVLVGGGKHLFGGDDGCAAAAAAHRLPGDDDGRDHRDLRSGRALTRRR
jgi:dihydrofolate reductase